MEETSVLDDTVQVMTMHKAKGKEYPVVFMALVHPECPHCEAMKPALENLYSNLEESSKELEALIRDIKENPRRYINFSIIGGSIPYQKQKK